MAETAAPQTATADSPRLTAAAAAAVLAMTLVGASAAVSSLLAGGPYLWVQGTRYGSACLLLVAGARLTAVRVVLPRGREWFWLAGVALLGLVLFNVGLVEGSRYAQPAVFGVAIACAPLLIAIAGPLLEGHRPRLAILAAAMVVVAGAGLVEGGGHANPAGLLIAGGVFLCEGAMTLLAVPVLGRQGAVGVSVHTTWIAALVFGVAGALVEGPRTIFTLTPVDLLTTAYLAAGVTALAFMLWYTAVRGLGSAMTGLFAGIAPVAAALTGVAIGHPVPGPLVWGGIGLVGAGLALGFASGRRRW